MLLTLGKPVGGRLLDDALEHKSVLLGSAALGLESGSAGKTPGEPRFLFFFKSRFLILNSINVALHWF